MRSLARSQLYGREGVDPIVNFSSPQGGADAGARSGIAGSLLTGVQTASSPEYQAFGGGNIIGAPCLTVSMEGYRAGSGFGGRDQLTVPFFRAPPSLALLPGEDPAVAVTISEATTVRAPSGQLSGRTSNEAGPGASQIFAGATNSSQLKRFTQVLQDYESANPGLYAPMARVLALLEDCVDRMVQAAGQAPDYAAFNAHFQDFGHANAAGQAQIDGFLAAINNCVATRTPFMVLDTYRASRAISPEGKAVLLALGNSLPQLAVNQPVAVAGAAPPPIAPGYAGFPALLVNQYPTLLGYFTSEIEVIVFQSPEFDSVPVGPQITPEGCRDALNFLMDISRDGAADLERAYHLLASLIRWPGRGQTSVRREAEGLSLALSRIGPDAAYGFWYLCIVLESMRANHAPGQHNSVHARSAQQLLRVRADNASVLLAAMTGPAPPAAPVPAPGGGGNIAVPAWPQIVSFADELAVRAAFPGGGPALDALVELFHMVQASPDVHVCDLLAYLGLERIYNLLLVFFPGGNPPLDFNQAVLGNAPAFAIGQLTCPDQPQRLYDQALAIPTHGCSARVCVDYPAGLNELFARVMAGGGYSYGSQHSLPLGVDHERVSQVIYLLAQLWRAATDGALFDLKVCAAALQPLAHLGLEHGVLALLGPEQVVTPRRNMDDVISRGSMMLQNLSGYAVPPMGWFTSPQVCLQDPALSGREGMAFYMPLVLRADLNNRLFGAAWTGSDDFHLSDCPYLGQRTMLWAGDLRVNDITQNDLLQLYEVVASAVGIELTFGIDKCVVDPLYRGTVTERVPVYTSLPVLTAFGSIQPRLNTNGDLYCPVLNEALLIHDFALGRVTNRPTQYTCDVLARSEVSYIYGTGVTRGADKRFDKSPAAARLVMPRFPVGHARWWLYNLNDALTRNMDASVLNWAGLSRGVTCYRLARGTTVPKQEAGGNLWHATFGARPLALACGVPGGTEVTVAPTPAAEDSQRAQAAIENKRPAATAGGAGVGADSGDETIKAQLTALLEAMRMATKQEASAIDPGGQTSTVADNKSSGPSI